MINITAIIFFKYQPKTALSRNQYFFVRCKLTGMLIYIPLYQIPVSI
jgi:hypothetical protein